MKTTRKILSLILAMAMLLSVCAISVAAEETASVVLTDIDNSTAEGKAVSRLVSMGIINGYPDNTFKAGNSITRAEFSVVMVKFLGMQDHINPSALTGFEDLDLDANYEWARPYVAMATARGIINGFEDKTFRAADPVTYEQAVKMIVCALGYEAEAKNPTIPGDWSSGYIAKAMGLGVTKSTSINNKTLPTTRGTVAILVNNALDAKVNDIVTGSGDLVLGGDEVFSDLGYKNVKGIVTGTYITELEYEKSIVPKDHIQIDDEIYEIGFSTSPYTFLGCHVEAVVDEDSDGDYPLIKSLELSNKTEVVTVKAGLFGDLEDGVFEYFKKPTSTKYSEVELDEEYVVIYNEKYVEDYDLEDVRDIESGHVDFIDNTGDGKVDVVRVTEYEVHVVYSKSSSTQKITFMYEEEDSAFTFPEDSTSLLFSLTRNGKEIAFKDIAKWDVLNIKASPEDAEGRRYYEVVVTRDTVTGTVKEMDASDESFIVIDDKEYVIADSYLELMEEEHEDVIELLVGEAAQVYLDAEGKIVAAAKTTAGNSAEKYAYLIALRQDSDDSEYDLEFRFYTLDGKFVNIGAAEKITIDNIKYKALDEEIVEYLDETAEYANKNYHDAENIGYRQLIIYQTNSSGLISVIHTVKSDENDNISMIMTDEDGDYYYSAYDEGNDGKGREYKSSSRSFTDFKVSSSTDIIFVPDNRGATDDYLSYSSYSRAFTNGREYHVEAFGLTSSKTATVVLIYHQNDSKIYTASTPWMIVDSKSQTKNGTIIKGYQSNSYSLKSVTVDEEDGPSVSALGKGDIIKYITNSKGHMIGYQIWFDASDPDQLQTVSGYEDCYTETSGDDDGIITKVGRILEIHSTSAEARSKYPSASFRLQFGTVKQIMLDVDGTVDEETITVSPFIAEDEIDINEEPDHGEITKEITSSVKVFSYDATNRNGEIVTEADLSEILDYETYDSDATRVIVYTNGSSSTSLRMIYIVTVE